jgi:HAMP domain-containing protein
MIDKMQKYQLQLQDNEKRAMEQVDRYKYELSMTQSSAQDMQSGMQNEVNSLRRELNDQRGRLGLL